MVVFDYDEFVLDVDPNEWNSLTIREQSTRLIIGYFEYKVNQKKTAEKETLVGHIGNELYREAAWQVWTELPPHEQKVLEALEFEFSNDSPGERLGECDVRVMTLLPDYFKRPNPKIKINVEKIHSYEEMLYAIRHELAHAAFRHGEMSQFWEAGRIGYQTAYDFHEKEAGCVATVWYGLAMDQMRKKANEQ